MAIRFRELGNDPGDTPQVSIGVDVNFLDTLQQGESDVDGRAEPRPRPVSEPPPPRPGDWIIDFGMAGIQDPAAVLSRCQWVTIKAAQDSTATMPKTQLPPDLPHGPQAPAPARPSRRERPDR